MLEKNVKKFKHGHKHSGLDFSNMQVKAKIRMNPTMSDSMSANLPRRNENYDMNYQPSAKGKYPHKR